MRPVRIHVLPSHGIVVWDYGNGVIRVEGQNFVVVYRRGLLRVIIGPPICTVQFSIVDERALEKFLEWLEMLREGAIEVRLEEREGRKQ